MDQGVLYYATGEKYYNQALSSAKSLKQHNEVDVTIYTNIQRNNSVFDKNKQIEQSNYPFYDRIKYYLESPYDQTLYLDTDTHVVKNISEIFNMFDRFDVLARIDPFRNTAGEHWGNDQYEVDVPESFPEYQCGVLGFKDTKVVRELFQDWRNRYGEYLQSDLIDQPFFREALFHSNINLGTLPPEYNLLVNNLNCLQKEAKILHFNGGYADQSRLPWNGRSKDEVADLINSKHPLRRVVYPNKYNCTEVFVEPTQSILLSGYKLLKDIFNI